jgi:hypothetical protein
MVTAIDYHTDAHLHAAQKAAVGVWAEISWAGVRPGAVRYTPVLQLCCEVKVYGAWQIADNAMSAEVPCCRACRRCATDFLRCCSCDEG